MRLTSNDPLRNFHVNRRVAGKVINFTNDGSAAFIELAPGVDGYLHRDEIQFSRPEKAQDALRDGDLVNVRIVDIDYDERRVRLTAFGLFVDTIYIPQSHTGLVIGKGGSVIKGLQGSHKVHIDLGEDGFCMVQGPSETSVRAAVIEIHEILKVRIFKFKLEKQRQIPMLLGKRGQTIQGIQNDLSVKIDLNNTTRDVTLTAPDQMSGHRAIERIRSAISFSEATVQIPPNRIGYVIGTGGSVINGIKSSSGAEVNIARDSSGQITITADSRAKVDRAIEQIRLLSQVINVISRDEGELPPITEYSGDVPPPRRSTGATTSPARPQSSIKPASDRVPIDTKVTEPPKSRPERVQQSIIVSKNHAIALTQKKGSFFARLFGNSQTPLAEIQAATKTMITVNSTTGEVSVVGSSAGDVAIAIERIRQTGK